MADDLERFAAELKHAARGLRRLDKETRRELGKRARDEVADPLAQRIAATFTGPWARVLAAGTRPRVAANPTVAVAGSRPVVSGGASVRQLVYGAQFGRGLYPRTRQFRHSRQTIYPTVRDELPTVLERTADVVLDVLTQELDHG